MYDLASTEMLDLRTCNALQRLNTRAPSSSAKRFWESLRDAATLNQQTQKIEMHGSKMVAIDCDTQYNTYIKLSF